MNKKVTLIKPSATIEKALPAQADTTFYVGDMVCLDSSGTAVKGTGSGGTLIGFVLEEQEVLAGQEVNYSSGYIVLDKGTGDLVINTVATIGATGAVDESGGDTGAVVRGFQHGRVLVEIGNHVESGE